MDIDKLKLVYKCIQLVAVFVLTILIIVFVALPGFEIKPETGLMFIVSLAGLSYASNGIHKINKPK